MGATEFELPVPKDSSWNKPLLENAKVGYIMDMATGGVEKHTAFKWLIWKWARDVTRQFLIPSKIKCAAPWS